MKTTTLWSLLLVCWLSAGAGCQGRPDSGTTAARDGTARTVAAEPRPAAASEDRPGRFRRTPPGRGLGRMLGGRGQGRGRGQYRPVEIAPAEVRSLGIATAKAVYRPTWSLHSAMGKVLAPQSGMAKVSYPFPARIAAVHVKIGDWVEKGKPVLTVQSEEIGRAKAEYYKAIADLELAKQNYERERRLSIRGVGAQKNTLSAEAGLKVAEATLEAAEKKLHVLGFSETEVRAIAGTHQTHAEITIAAPISGRVIEHKAVLGSMVDQTTDLMTLMDPTTVWVEAEVFERDIAKVSIGQEAQVAVPAYPGEVFRGKITHIGETVHRETRTLSVRTEIQNRDFRLKDGMFAEVSIILGSSRRVLAVPSEAVLEDDDDNIVFVRSGDQYAPRIVAVSSEHNGYCAIADGLREGEEVVVRNSYTLKSKLYDELLKKAHVH